MHPFIFATVGVAGSTDHDYDNRWEGNHLRWYHQKRSHLGWRSVTELLEPGRRILWSFDNSTPPNDPYTPS
ncbi:MAG: hypothetical protein F4168_13180, partial [Gemmatimonadetes bacterium]|nr:hypothetical protein [Gemmatimonadota bacterium]